MSEQQGNTAHQPDTPPPDLAAALAALKSPDLAVALARVRRRHGLDQDLFAQALTHLMGVPVNVAQLQRIEAGKQPMTPELLLLLVVHEGLRGLLEPLIPFRMATVPVMESADLDELLDPRTSRGVRTALDFTAKWAKNRELASRLAQDPHRVWSAAHQLYGHPAHQEIADRAERRRAELGIPGDSPKARTVQGHATRSVARELAAHIQEQDK